MSIFDKNEEVTFFIITNYAFQNYNKQSETVATKYRIYKLKQKIIMELDYYKTFICVFVESNTSNPYPKFSKILTGQIKIDL